MGKQVAISWLARLALSELADRRGKSEQEVLEDLIKRAAVQEMERLASEQGGEG